MNVQYLAQAQAILSKCGRPTLPGGVSAVPLFRAFLMPMSLQPGGAVTFVKEIAGTAPWVLRAISSDQASASLVGVRVQIQLPNGRFLFGGSGIDIGQFAWVGSYRWLQDPELRCEPGGKINVTLTDTGGITEETPVNLLFEGAFLHFVKGADLSAPGSAASLLPRYQGIINENILSPAWSQNEGLETPAGFEDEAYTYSTPTPIDQPAQTTWTITAGAITTPPNPLPFEIQIERVYQYFFVRRILPDVQFTGDASAIVLGKLRTGAGYVLNDSYIDLARYLCGAEFPGQWQIKGSDSAFVDVALAEVSGTGTVTFQMHLEGFRRRAV